MRKIVILFSVLFLLAPRSMMAAGENTYNIMDYGAKGDGTSDDAAALQTAIDRCSAEGGGVVVVPAGHTFLCSPFHLASYVELRIEANACLLANPDEAAYTESAFGENRGEGMMWISGKDLRQVSITGLGTLDGNGLAFMAGDAGDSFDLKPVTTFDPRPHLLTLENVERLVIRDVTFRNSAYWTVHLAGCDDVTIDGISILNNIKIRNGDGIDLDHSRHVRIANCHIESGDDSICLKNRREYEQYGACEDIVITNCMLQSRSCAFKIGSENVDAIRRVLVDNCIIVNSNRGIGIQNRDEGTVEDVVFANMHVDCHFYSDTWWGKAEPIYVTSYPRPMADNKDGSWRFPKGATRGECGEVSHITFDNIVCRSENGIFVGGDVAGKVNHITFRNIDLLLAKTTDYPGRLYDKRPCEGDAFVYADTHPFYIDTASDILIDGYRLEWGSEKPLHAAEGVKEENAERVEVR